MMKKSMKVTFYIEWIMKVMTVFIPNMRDIPSIYACMHIYIRYMWYDLVYIVIALSLDEVKWYHLSIQYTCKILESIN